MKKTVLYILALLISTNLMGQSSKMPISIGFFAPYGINLGLKVGTALELNKWENSDSDKFQTLSVSPQLGYFTYQSYENISNTIAVETSLDYRRYTNNQSFYGLGAVGLGYHAELQRVDASVNVGTGAITHNTRTNHYFVPTAILGFGKVPVKRLGYYFKGFVGQRINPSVGNALLFGAELGLTFNVGS